MEQDRIAELRRRVEALGSLQLRSLGQRFGVPPHFKANGRMQWLRTVTLRERILDRASGGRWAELESCLDNLGAAQESHAQAPEAAPEAAHADKPIIARDQRQAVRDAFESIGIGGGLDAEAVQEIVDKRVAEKLAEAALPRVYQIERNGETRKIEGLFHKQFDVLVRRMRRTRRVWIAGAAGTGKTQAFRQVAEVLGLDFYFDGAMDSEFKVMGFVNAAGVAVWTPFRTAFTHGGLWLGDEFDGTYPNASLALNAALENGHATFPGECKPVPMHPDFYVAIAANTFGHGSDGVYVGRMKQDAAFADRFSFLPWEIDEKLERSIARSIAGDKADALVDKVQAIRRAVEARGLKILVTPRASFMGCKIIADFDGEPGESIEAALDAQIFSRLPKQERDALKAAV